MTTLTLFEVEQWIKGKGERGGTDALCDGDNLWLTRKASGNPVWVLRYRWGRRRREYTIGPYREVGGLPGGRKEALKLRARIVSGEDIAQSKRIDRLGRNTGCTYSALLADYVSTNEARLSPVTVKELRRMQARDIEPNLGPLLAREIKPLDLVRLLREISRRSYSVSRRIWEQLSVIFAHGVAAGHIEVSPCASLRVSAVLGSTPPKKQRIKLTRDELQTVLLRLPSQGEVNTLATMLLLYSCVRKSELLKAKWEHINFEAGVWNVPAEITGNKLRRAYTIPLVPVAISWFKRLKEIACLNDWVLPPQARNSKIQTMSASTLNNMMIRIGGGIRHFSPHDCRSTARSYLSELFPNRQLAIESALNHSIGGVMGKYEKNDFLEERKEMLVHWAGLLESLARGENSNVVSILKNRLAA